MFVYPPASEEQKRREWDGKDDEGPGIDDSDDDIGRERYRTADRFPFPSQG
jgi:hypothetical protein